MMFRDLFMFALLISAASASGCIRRYFKSDSFVCVCNSTYCDGVANPNPAEPTRDNVYMYLSSKEKSRLHFSTGKVGECNTKHSEIVQVDRSKTYQKILGFGAAFTDSAGINVMKLSPETQDQLMRTYYGPHGSRYNMGRIPIGGCDFSTRPYTYDDYPNDYNLSHFSLAPEDYDYKLPLLQKAIKLNPEVKFVSAAWSAPPWMKTNNNYYGLGALKEECYQVYSEYLIKFFDAYEKNGVKVWGITTGNEPLDAYVPFFPINSLGWLPQTAGTWVADNFGPTLSKSRFNDTLLLAMDDQRFELPWWPDLMFQNKRARDYVHGIAYHWYWNTVTSVDRLDETHDRNPDKFILMTEACTGANFWDFPKVDLGSWARGEAYAKDIIENMNHWVVGWLDWNLALDETGGPNWISNYVDSPIIVVKETDEFLKQPMYYALKHFSRFVPRGSKRISVATTSKVHVTAFETPTRKIVVVLCNDADHPRKIAIKDTDAGSICLELPAHSIQTVIY